MPRPPARPPPFDHWLRERARAGRGRGADDYRPPTKQEALVAAIKKYQTSSPRARQRWRDFADANLGGTRGPSRRNPDALEAFF
eukprot:10170232-Alexandrium_andersonii.AAC.1